jgi:hypothetical protein
MLKAIPTGSTVLARHAQLPETLLVMPQASQARRTRFLLVLSLTSPPITSRDTARPTNGMEAPAAPQAGGAIHRDR